MRRFLVSLTAAVGTAALSACSGGGSVLNFQNNPNPTLTIITVQSPLNLARVLPGAGLPLSAVQTNGSQNGFLSGNRFLWSATLTTGGQYPYNAQGQTKPCASVMGTTGGVTTALTGDFGIYIAIDPTNESNVILFPPVIVPAPAGVTSVQTNYPYCVTVSAQPGKISGTGLGTTFTPNGPAGSILVEVVDPQNPLQ